ncbi:8327_t:CDS:10, partial [Ambispora gerdemannii]
NERFSERINKFWMTINEELTNDKIKTEENEYDLTLTTNVNKQMGTYVNATTSRLTKRFLECAKGSPPKRVAKLVVSGTSDGNDSDKSYHPSSDEPDDDTFVEIKKRINYTYDWFTGPGIKKSSLSEGAKKWVIDTLDVSSLLLEYRDMSVQRASENKIEEVAEILSLNHIFLFEQNVTNGISSMIEPESLNIIFDTIKNEFAPYHLSNDDVLQCYKMAKTACEDFGKCKSLLRKWQKDLDDDQEDLILETFESIINNFKPEVYRQGLKEDSFVHEVFEPVIRPFLRNINFKCEWSTDDLEASVHRKRKFDPILQGRKADFSVYMPIRGNEMKDIIDKCIDDGVKNNDLIICGLLVEGFQCRLFAMDLKYEAIYRMILLGKFYLPRDSSDLGVLPTSIERLIQMKEASPTKDISSHIESHSYEEKGITPDPLPEIEYSSTQSESSTEPEISTISLPQDIIDDDSAETLEFLETIHKKRISSEIRERNQEKKLQGLHNNLTQSETSTMSTPESLDLKTVKKLWDQNQNKSLNKTSQSHKKKGTENIAQVIADGIQDNIISDESEARSFASSNHVSTPVKPQTSNSSVKTKILPEVKTSEESIATPQLKKILTEKQNNPTHDHAYFRNKILLRYSNLYKTIISEKNDYYGIVEGSLCPVCKLNHEDEKSIKGRYEAGSYFIICGKCEIEITE